MRPLTALVGVLLGALALPALPSAQAATTDQSYWVPVDGRIVVRGHGYGHGHGMSQYGAYGAALEGLTHREILDFYYPGTSWSEVTGPVRVLITADTTRDVVVSPAAGLRVRDLGDGTTYPLPDLDGVTRWRLNVADGETVLGYRTDRWRRYRPAGRAHLVGDGEFLADEPIRLWTPTGSRSYRGALRAASPTPGSADRDTVNVVSMDTYVQGVIPYEMPASWPMEAVRAQAVAARTYASWSRRQNLRRYYQICDTTACQVYGGVDGEHPRSNDAVAATARRILTFEGSPAFTQFSASSGGWTSAGTVPYLPAQPDPYDRHEYNPVDDWSVPVDATRLERAYPELGRLRRIQVTARDGNGEWGGRVWRLVLDGTRADRTMSGDEFRWFFGLRSNWFSIDPTPIIQRWDGLGGAGSVLGEVRTGEYAVPRGSVQRFERGRIYHSPANGAHELFGPVLAAYVALDGPSGRLGLPTTGIRARGGGVRAKFVGGTVWSSERTGTVPLLGDIAARYQVEGGLRSGLGWPVRGNYRVAVGERADFERGSIIWRRRSDTTRVVRSS